MQGCLLLGHAPVEMSAAPDPNRCRMANQPTLLPGQAVVICARCGTELYSGPIEHYLALADGGAETRAMH